MKSSLEGAIVALLGSVTEPTDRHCNDPQLRPSRGGRAPMCGLAKKRVTVLQGCEGLYDTIAGSTLMLMIEGIGRSRSR